MSTVVNDSLKQIARGAGYGVLGLLLALLIQFISKLVIARYYLEAGYGIFSLALLILNFAMIVSSLGLQEGCTRYIAYFLGRNDNQSTARVVLVTAIMTVMASILIGAVLYFSASEISTGIFHTSELIVALRAFAPGVPLYTMIVVVSAIFRGFSRVKTQVIFQFMMHNFIFVLCLLIIVLLRLPFSFVFYAYTFSLAVTLVVLVIYSLVHLPRLVACNSYKIDISTSRELLVFSLPLMMTLMLSTLIISIDTVILGYFKAVTEVGLYSAAYNLAYMTYLPSAAFAMIYTPVATRLYANDQQNELNRIYTISIKWVVFLSMPFFLILCFFPSSLMSLIYGQSFIPAGSTLPILATGFLVSNLLCAAMGTLVAIGESKNIMWFYLTGAIINILLSMILIPVMGIAGAAIASAVSLASVVFMQVIRLYLIRKMQPFSKNMLKPIVASVMLAFLLKFIIGNISINWWILALIFICYYGIYGVSVVLTRSFDREDIALLLDIERLSGIDAEPLKKILRKFV